MIRFLTLLPLLALPLSGQRPLPDTAELERELKRFMGVYAVLDSEGAEPVAAEAALYGGAIPGMLRQLDPHSVFFDRGQFAQLQEMQQSVSKGFGSIVSVLPGRVIVLETQAGSPSQRSGLAPGDEIVAINGIPLSRLDIDQLVQLLGMSRQKPAGLSVRRQGLTRLLQLTLTPAELQAPSVDRAFLLEPGIAYVRVASFDAATAREFKERVEKLGGAGLRGLVLDLRGNPGGVVTAALELASLFLEPGQKILSARGRSAETKDVDAPREARPYPWQVAVLIDARTASAAEIVAGALQDHKRARILGETSFGKGLVQSVFPLSDGAGLALTTAFYYTPGGRSIQRPLRNVALAQSTQSGQGGIVPDVTVRPDTPSRLRVVLEMSGAFADFATSWLASHRSEVTRDFQVAPALAGEFQLWLSQRNIRPSVRDWTAERAFIDRRLKQEILNQTVGVVAGDEVELRGDAAVRQALDILRGN